MAEGAQGRVKPEGDDIKEASIRQRASTAAISTVPRDRAMLDCVRHEAAGCDNGGEAMRRPDDIRIWMVTGALGSMVLAIVLVPLRSAVTASNLAFVFIAFTIVVAELGGRGPALVTALVSAMSLNFFLTEPYLTLAISKTDDVVAFFALAACGLIAAAFGQRRERLSEMAGRADRELAILSRLVERARGGRPLDALLQDLRAEFDLGGLALRDASGAVLAAAPREAASRPGPRLTLDPHTLFAAADESPRMGTRGLRLPEDGGRLTLQTARGAVSLDLWEGNDQGFGRDESRTLAIAFSILGLGMR
jgi:two-component system sensor histidine kinase KdpD